MLRSVDVMSGLIPWEREFSVVPRNVPQKSGRLQRNEI